MCIRDSPITARVFVNILWKCWIARETSRNAVPKRESSPIKNSRGQLHLPSGNVMACLIYCFFVHSCGSPARCYAWLIALCYPKTPKTVLHRKKKKIPSHIATALPKFLLVLFYFTLKDHRYLPNKENVVAKSLYCPYVGPSRNSEANQKVIISLFAK